MKETTKGTLLTLVAGTAWGLSGVSGQYLMSHGFGVEVLTTIRLLLAGIFLLGLAYWQSRDSLKSALTNAKSLLAIAVFAILGLVLNQMSYLNAIHHTNAGTATVLQYLCPVLVLTYTCLKDRKKPTMVELSSIFLAILGTILIATHGQLTQLSVTPLGLFWGLFSALTYAIYIIIPVDLIHRYGSLTVMGLGMLMGGIALSLTFQTWQADLPINSGTVWGLVGIVGVGTIFAYTAFLQGVSMVGPVKGSLLASIEPIAAVIFSIWLLQEAFHAIDLLGMVLILVAVTLVSLRDLSGK